MATLQLRKDTKIKLAADLSEFHALHISFEGSADALSRGRRDISFLAKKHGATPEQVEAISEYISTRFKKVDNFTQNLLKKNCNEKTVHNVRHPQSQGIFAFCALKELRKLQDFISAQGLPAWAEDLNPHAAIHENKLAKYADHLHIIPEETTPAETESAPATEQAAPAAVEAPAEPVLVKVKKRTLLRHQKQALLPGMVLATAAANGGWLTLM